MEMHKWQLNNSIKVKQYVANHLECTMNDTVQFIECTHRITEISFYFYEDVEDVRMEMIIQSFIQHIIQMKQDIATVEKLHLIRMDKAYPNNTHHPTSVPLTFFSFLRLCQPLLAPGYTLSLNMASVNEGDIDRLAEAWPISCTKLQLSAYTNTVSITITDIGDSEWFANHSLDKAWVVLFSHPNFNVTHLQIDAHSFLDCQFHHVLLTACLPLYDLHIVMSGNSIVLLVNLLPNLIGLEKHIHSIELALDVFYMAPVLFGQMNRLHLYNVLRSFVQTTLQSIDSSQNNMVLQMFRIVMTGDKIGSLVLNNSEHLDKKHCTLEKAIYYVNKDINHALSAKIGETIDIVMNELHAPRVFSKLIEQYTCFTV